MSENLESKPDGKERWEVTEGKSPNLGEVIGVVVAGTCYKEGEQAVCIVSELPKATEEDRRRANLIAAAPMLLEALEMLMDDLDSLMRESEGVAGLHLNGDIAPWSDIDEAGAFERLSGRFFARTAIAKATGKGES